jgi:hypothetical protein
MTNDLFFSVLLLMNIPDGVLRIAMVTKAMSFFQDNRPVKIHKTHFT